MNSATRTSHCALDRNEKMNNMASNKASKIAFVFDVCECCNIFNLQCMQYLFLYSLTIDVDFVFPIWSVFIQHLCKSSTISFCQIKQLIWWNCGLDWNLWGILSKIYWTYTFLIRSSFYFTNMPKTPNHYLSISFLDTYVRSTQHHVMLLYLSWHGEAI